MTNMKGLLHRERVSELAAIWAGLVSGAWKVKTWSYTEKAWSLVVVSRQRTAVPSARDLEILQQMLLCGRTTQVAARTKLSKSSIHLIQQSCLRFMGVDCTPLRVPGLLAVAAHAHQRDGRGHLPSKAITKITISRPDHALAPLLTIAQHEVIKLLLEGRTYVEIAQERGTSVRTVANQVAGSFQHLGVSGRSALISRLAATWVRDEREAYRTR